MNARDRAILYGMAIGDGHISYRIRYKDNKYRYEHAELIMGHYPKQKDYLQHKADLIYSIFGGKKPVLRTTSHTLKATNKTYVGFRYAKTNPYFRQMHRNLYTEDRKKKITSKILSYLDVHSLALWYMDDGSMSYNKNKSGEITSLSFSICTQVSEEEADLIIDWLKENFDISARKYCYKDKYDVRGSTQASLTLAHTIHEYVVPCMMYKLAPAFNFVFRKSAKHPNFKVDEDIVQALGIVNPEK